MMTNVTFCGSNEIKLLKYVWQRKIFQREVVGEMTHTLQIQIHFPLSIEVPGITKTNPYALPQRQKSAAHIQHPTNSFFFEKKGQ
jgi:hypothetical protein